jgi:glycosyltransferase involved in cell wall biosynthesis
VAASRVIGAVNFLMDPRIGGPQRYVTSVSETLRPEVTTMIVTTGRGPITELALFNLRQWWRPLYVVEIPLNVMLILVLRMLGRVPASGTVYDVHGSANLAPLIAAWLLKVPVVWHFHETYSPLKRFANLGRRFLRPNACAVVAVAHGVARAFNLQRYTVIYPPVDLRFWKRSSSEPVDSGETSGFHLVCVGNLNPLKGQDVLLDALMEFRRPFQLTMVGATLDSQQEYAERILEKIVRLKQINPDAEVRLVGWQSPEEIRKILNRCDVFVMPSRSEGCPIALLEAMAMECACIATDVGGVAEVLEDHHAGFLVRDSDSQALLQAIESVCVMSVFERLKIGSVARQRVEARCAIQRVADAHLAIYRELLGDQPWQKKHSGKSC